MALTALQTFLAILDAGSLVRAAERLNVTQSTVTARLKTLEDNLGQTLINRQRSGVTPTAAGLRLKRYAETMTELWRQARRETALPGTVSTVCNIGCHPDLWPHLGDALFEHIRQADPGAALSVWHGGQTELATWIGNGLVDLALIHGPPARPGRSVHALPADRLVLVSTRPAAPIRFDPGYVFVEAGEEFGRQHAAAYSDAGVARLSFGSAGLGLDHILNHGGSAYLPERIAAPLIAEQRLHLLADAPVFTRPVFLVVNDAAASAWPWLSGALARLSGH